MRKNVSDTNILAEELGIYKNKNAPGNSGGVSY